MQVLLTTFNSSYIHKNLALRWIYVARDKSAKVKLKEFTINDDVNKAVDYVFSNNFDALVLSVYIWNVNESKQLIKAIRKKDKKIKIIIGGPEVTYENNEWFDLGIDGIVMGEGERSVWDYLINNDDQYVKLSKTDFKPIRREDIEFLESLEDPYSLDFDLKDIDKQYMYIEASRGCPFRCSYCLSSLDNKVRFFSLDYLKRVFDKLKPYNINQVKFLDRTFNANKSRTKKLYKMLEEYKNIESFQVEIVADKLSDDLVELITMPQNRHRFRYEVGIQSFNQKTLKSVDRIQDNQKTKRVIKTLLENDVIIHADLIAGLPYENLESFADSFNQLASIKPSELQLGILKLLKGTKMKEDAIALNYKASDLPPYEVFKTPWLNKEEMDYINIVAKGVDRSINRNILKRTIEYLGQNFHDNLFLVFYKIGQVFEDLGIDYQKYDVFINVYKKFKNDVNSDILKTILNIDYFEGEKQKPKVLFSEKNVKEINHKLAKNSFFSQEEIYKYSRKFKDYRSEDACIFVLFNKKQRPCSIYRVDFKEKKCKKIS